MANKAKKLVNEDSIKAVATIGLMGIALYLASDKKVKKVLRTAIDTVEKNLETTENITQKAKDFLG